MGTHDCDVDSTMKDSNSAMDKKEENDPRGMTTA